MAARIDSWIYASRSMSPIGCGRFRHLPKGRLRGYVHRCREYSIRVEDDMAKPDLDEGRLKELLKEAVAEVLDERRDLMRGVIEEALEDMAMARAIQAGEGTPEVSREEIFRILAPGE